MLTCQIPVKSEPAASSNTEETRDCQNHQSSTLKVANVDKSCKGLRIAQGHLVNIPQTVSLNIGSFSVEVENEASCADKGSPDTVPVICVSSQMSKFAPKTRVLHESNGPMMPLCTWSSLTPVSMQMGDPSITGCAALMRESNAMLMKDRILGMTSSAWS